MSLKDKKPIKEHKLTKEEIEQNKIADKIIADSYFEENDLPDFPEIVHPVIGVWMELASRLSYSRKAFHFANLLPVLAMGIGRKTHVAAGLKTFYCNINVMTAGISTISGKSYSADAVTEHLAPAVFHPDLMKIDTPTENSRMITKAHSNAAFNQAVCATFNLLWNYDESREFFVDGDGWNKSIMKNLCTAYDCGVLSRSLSKREKNDPTNLSYCDIPFVCLNFNMTLTELNLSCTGNLYSSGFAPRWLWFIEHGGKIEKNVTITEYDRTCIRAIYDAIHHVAITLKELDNDSIRFNVNDRIEQWKMDTSDKYKDSEAHQTAIGRAFVHIYKIAMILGVYDPVFQTMIFDPKCSSTKTYPLYIDLPDKWVTVSIEIVEKYLFPRTLKVLQMSEIEDKKNHQVIVIEALKKLKGAATQSELLRKTHMGAFEMNSALVTLLQSNEIKKVEKIAPKTGGTSASVYCLNREHL